MKNGDPPGPAAVVTVPIRDCAGHPPASASASEHSGTLPTFARNPFGNSTFSPARFWVRSGFVIDIPNGVNEPPAGFAEPPDIPGSNDNPAGQPAPCPSHDTSNELNGIAATGDEYGVNADVAVFVPQLWGIASTPRSPPWKSNVIFENGIGGLSRNVVVI